MASKPARIRLLWAILSLVLPITFGHTTSCRNRETFHLLFHRLAPFPLVLGCGRLLFGVDTESCAFWPSPHEIFYGSRLLLPLLPFSSRPTTECPDHARMIPVPAYVIFQSLAKIPGATATNCWMRRQKRSSSRATLRGTIQGHL